MDMPGYLDYGKIMQMNPFAAYQANQQMDLAKQFQDQKYQQEQNTTNKGTLENIFSAQDNPERLQSRILQNQGQDLTNEGQGYKNRTGKLEAERGEANQQNVLSADQRAAALKMTTDQMTEFDQHVKQLLQDPNSEANRREGAKLQTYLSSYQTERRKAADAMALQKEQTNAHIGGINAQGSNQLKLEDQQYKHGKYDPKKFSLSISQRVLAAKNPIEKMEILENAYATAKEQGDEASAAIYADRYKAAQQRAAEQERLRANAKSTMDMTDYGVQQAAPLVPSAPIAVDAKPTPQMTPQDSAALDWAKANPNDPRSAKILQKLGR